MYKFYNKIFVQPPGYIKQLLLAMKLTALLVTIGILQVSAATYAQKVTLKDKNTSLKEVFNQIRQQSGYDFIITSDLLSQAKPVTIEVSNTDLRDALDKIFDDQPLNYTIQEKTVIVSKKEGSFLDKLKSKIKAELAQVTVTTSVHDELGQPMAGVTVRQKDANNTTITDTKGNFSITVPDANAIVAFSYIGYESQELRARYIPNGSVITLKVAENNLKEVVINKGYYSVQQQFNTGDVTVIGSKAIEQQPVTDPIQALIGRVAGLNIQQSSGLPGANATIRLRGQNSIANGNDPLYIIDGVPFNANSLSTPYGFDALRGSTFNNFSNGQGISPFSVLNTQDIESIEVLKDADATAIYGSRGANGVILITTKKGRAGDTRFNLNLTQGYSELAHNFGMMNTPQYLQMREEAYRNDGISPSLDNGDYDLLLWDTTRNTNWQKILLGKKASYSNAQGTLTGGTDNTQFLIGFGFNRQGSVSPGDFSDQKVSGHASITHTSPDKKLSLQFTASYDNDDNKLPTVDFASLLYRLPPDAPALYDSHGNLNWGMYQGSPLFFNNPAQYLLYSNSAVTNNFNSSLTSAYRMLPGLEFRFTLGYNHDEMDQNRIGPATAAVPPDTNTPNGRGLLLSNTSFSRWDVEPQLNYHREIGRGKLNVLAGGTLLQQSTSNLSQSFFGFTSDALIANPAFASASRVLAANQTQYNYASLYGQASYNWADKYIINATVRRDGSSRFGPGKQFGNFGAVGGAWLFGDEPFVRNSLPFLNFGKLRVSYGVTGNDQIADYQYMSTYSSAGTSSYQGATGLVPSGLANPDFAWEVVKKLEFGTDLSFLKDRINLSASYYRNRTSNQLVGYPLPTVAGFTSVQFNLPAIVQNTGLELMLNTVNVKTTQFSWSTNVNFTLPQNKLVSFPGLANFAAYKNRLVVGQSLYIQKLAQYTGVDPQTGLYTFATANSNGLPSSSEYVVSPPITQKFYGGIENTFTYQAWSLDIFFRYVNQIGLSPLGLTGSSPGDPLTNQPAAVGNGRWQQPGDHVSVQRFGTYFGSADDTFSTWQRSTGALTGASFLRLQNISLTYQAPVSWARKMHMQSLKIYVQGQNLLTVTKYPVLDPEMQSYTLPPLRTMALGVQATF